MAVAAVSAVAVAAASGRAACGRGKGVDAFRDAHLKLVAASGRGSLANHLGRACEQPALRAQGLSG
jgi:hypothetical protein